MSDYKPKHSVDNEFLKNISKHSDKEESNETDIIIEKELSEVELKLKQTEEELKNSEDRIKRLVAEFENFKKRSEKERENLYSSVLADVINIILPTIDNLETACKAETADTSYKNGIELVLKQLIQILDSKGIKQIKAIGEKFDPSLHEAVAMVEDSTLGSKVIKEEYRKGYIIGDKVIRYSLVVVAN